MCRQGLLFFFWLQLLITALSADESQSWPELFIPANDVLLVCGLFVPANDHAFLFPTVDY